AVVNIFDSFAGRRRRSAAGDRTRPARQIVRVEPRAREVPGQAAEKPHQRGTGTPYLLRSSSPGTRKPRPRADAVCADTDTVTADPVIAMPARPCFRHTLCL